MKTLFLSLVLTLSFSAFANEKGNGGDPFIVNASKFPDQNKIENAVHVITEKLSTSTLGNELKLKLIQEARELLKEGKYLYLENIIVIGEAPEGYSIPQDAGQFLAFGAMTYSGLGGNIYFSESALKHTDDKFQELLLHELLHHVLTPGLSQNEIFIERLTSEILTRNISERTLKAIELRVFFTKGHVSSEEIYDYFEKRYDVIQPCIKPYAFSGKDYPKKREEFCKKKKVLARELYKAKVPKNVAEKSIKEFLEVSTKHFSFALDINADTRGYETSVKIIEKLRVDLGLSRKRADANFNKKLERFFGITN